MRGFPVLRRRGQPRRRGATPAGSPGSTGSRSHRRGRAAGSPALSRPGAGRPSSCSAGPSRSPRFDTSPLANLLSDPPAAKHAGLPRLGVLHGDLDASGGPYAPFTRRELDAVGLDAWLLGHIHKPSLGSGPAGHGRDSVRLPRLARRAGPDGDGPSRPVADPLWGPPARSFRSSSRLRTVALGDPRSGRSGRRKIRRISVIAFSTRPNGWRAGSGSPAMRRASSACVCA